MALTPPEATLASAAIMRLTDGSVTPNGLARALSGRGRSPGDHEARA